MAGDLHTMVAEVVDMTDMMTAEGGGGHTAEVQGIFLYNAYSLNDTYLHNDILVHIQEAHYLKQKRLYQK